jgi:TetR/AcrR family transcriptional repressor of lmrAB and yxaGH operons
MPRAPRSDSRDRFLDATADLLRRRGYHGTGLNDVVAASGAPKGSLYFHFPGGKEALAAEATERASRQFGLGIQAALDRGSSPPDTIRRLARGMAAGLDSSNYECGCPIATVALEAAATSDALAAACDGAFSDWTARLAAWLESAGGLPAEEARDTASLVLASLEGALILSRARRDPAPLHTVGDRLATLLEARCAS